MKPRFGSCKTMGLQLRGARQFETKTVNRSLSGYRFTLSEWPHPDAEAARCLWAVRWYCRYGVSYRDLEEMLHERGVVFAAVAPFANHYILVPRGASSPLLSY